MASSLPSQAAEHLLQTYEPKSATYAAPIERDEGDSDDEWARATDDTTNKGSPAPAAVVTVPSKTIGKGKRKLADVHGGISATLPPQDSSTVATAPLLVPAPTSPGFFLTRGHPINKPNYRYVACGPAPGCSLTHPLYRVIPSPPVDGIRFSWEDRSQYLAISRDAMSVTADKGFRSARANVPLREGIWYFEVHIQKGGGDPGHWQGGGAHVRLGVGRRECPLTAPVGFDGYSYGIRDKTGEAITLSQPKAYGSPFGTGDTIGVMLSLPPRTPADPLDDDDPAHLRRKRIPIRYKGQLYFESFEYPSAREMVELQTALTDHGTKKPTPKVKAAAPGTRRIPQIVPPPLRPLQKLPGSRLEFFKNGEPMGTAYEDLYDYLPLRAHARPKHAKPIAPGSDAARENHHDDGTCGYYPFVSCFGGGIATLVPGPDFRFPPTGTMKNWRPLSERYPEYTAETLALDEVDETELRAVFDAQAEELAKRTGKKAATNAYQRPQFSEAAASPISLDAGTPLNDAMAVDRIDTPDNVKDEDITMDVDTTSL